MIRIICFFCILCIFSCATNKKAELATELPSCLQTKIKTFAPDSPEGMPQSITRYIYKGKTVYYLLAACCDNFNIVYDGGCNVLGYPDGGFTGRGDGKLPDFFKEAKEGKVVWKNR